MTPFNYEGTLFLSTPSARRATQLRSERLLGGDISIHALREEGDGDDLLQLLRLDGFLSTPSARRATTSFAILLQAFVISIHALREEGDR